MKQKLCKECYLKEHKLNKGEECELSFEMFLCEKCGKIKPTVVNIKRLNIIYNQ